MRLNINKNIRKILIFTIIVILLIFSYLIYNKAYKPGFEEQKIPVYSYNNKSSINYSVNLKPNNLYNSNKLEKGKLYITEFVDYIDTNIKYEFIGEGESEIKGEYNIIAKIRGFSGEGEKLINIWDKDFYVLQHKNFNTKDSKISINERVKLNLSEYNTFVKEIKEASKINCQTSLTLSMNVNLTGTTDKWSIEESISPSLVIPLDVAMFEITENNIVDEPGAIEETIKVQIPVNKNLVIIYSIILVVLIIALIILIFFTQALPDKDPFEKELKKIFKKHGDRLVALNSEVEINNSIVVKSIDDLVKISDEIGKPILYKYSDNYKEINKFYVTNEDEIYVFNLEIFNISEQIQIDDIEEKNNISDNISIQIMTESQLSE